MPLTFQYIDELDFKGVYHKNYPLGPPDLKKAATKGLNRLQNKA